MNKEKVRKFLFWGFEFSKVALILVIVGLLFHYFLLTVFVVQGASMEPNFKDNEAVLVERVSYLFKEPQRGDTVILKFPGRPSEKYVKRIIALPKETVEIKGGFVFINNQKLDEKYLPINIKTIPELKKTLKEDEYFVLGDNRENSNDSRVWGTCSKNYLVGKAIFALWPISFWGPVSKPSY